MLQKNVNPYVIETIHKKSMQVLAQKGVKFISEKAIQIFSKHNFKIEGDVVFFTEEQIQTALDSTPSQFTIKARDSKFDVTIGGGRSIICPAYGPVFVSRNNERRLGVKEDMINFAKLMQSSKTIDMMNPYIIAPSDIDIKDLLMYQQSVCLRYGTKPTMSITAGYEESKKAIKMIKKCNSKNQDDYVTIGLISALSPLAFDDTMIGGLIAFAEEKQPIILGCGALPGATSPISTMGTMITANCELLAGITLAQLICKGLPCVFGNMAAGTDMRFVTPAIGTPEAGKIVLLTKALCQYYKIPCRGGGSLSDAKETDYGAGAESTMVMMSALSAGTDYVIHSVGILDSFNVVGYEKFVLDEQNIESIKFLLGEVNCDEDHIGMDTILEVEHAKQYLSEEHTFNYMNEEILMPEISTRGYYDIWQSHGAPTLLDNANKVIEKRLAEFVLPEIDEKLAKELDTYINV